MGEVEYLQRTAQDRRDKQKDNERKILGTHYTYRQVCDKVANCAQKFQIVGDLVAKAEPQFAALPWVGSDLQTIAWRHLTCYRLAFVSS